MRPRVATTGDEQRIGSILRPSYERLMAEVYPPALLARVLPGITRANPGLISSGFYYLVEADCGEPAGCGGWSPHPPGAQEADPRRGHIRHFATHPDWLHRGVGRLLYDRCESDARAAGFTAFECWASLNGEPFYAALGFRRLGLIQTPMPGEVLFPAVRMERTI